MFAGISKGLGNLRKGQSAPHLEGHDITIDFGQTIHGFLQQTAAFTVFDFAIEPLLRRVQVDGGFARGASIIPARHIHGAASNRGEDQSRERRRSVRHLPPGFHHGVLHQVLRIRLATGLLPRKQEEPGRILRQPSSPF